MLTSTRVTYGEFADDCGRCIRQDNWACKSGAEIDMGKPWAGRIVFIPGINEMGGNPDPDEHTETRSQMLTRKHRQVTAGPKISFANFI